MAAAQPGAQSSGSSDVTFTPLQDQPDGIAGLDPTSPQYLELLQQQAADLQDAAEQRKLAAATAALRKNAGKTYSARVRQWQGVNPDVKAWIRVPGTNIDYPVCYNSNIDYYLHRGYYGEYSTNGVVWTNGDTRFGTSAQISRNTVLYGHNWTNYSAEPRVGDPNDIMFAQLTSYHYLSTAQANPYLYYSTANQDMVFKVFACFYTELSFDYINSAGGQYILNEARARSRFNFDVDVNTSDKILTLSTCTRAYGHTSNQRFVVMARLLRSGEKISPYSITENTGNKEPSVW